MTTQPDSGPTFEVSKTIQSTDRWGRTVYVSVVTMNGHPAFSFVSSDEGHKYTPGERFSHTVSGVGVQVNDEFGMGDSLAWHSVPTSGTARYTADHLAEVTTQTVLDSQVEALAWSRGSTDAEAILTKSEGAPKTLAADESEAYYEGARSRAARWGYHLRGLRLAKNPEKKESSRG